MNNNSSALLSVEHVSKRFAGLQAVGGDDGLTFAVDKGAFIGLIGPNGAGKSTTFNLLSGVLATDTGRVCFDGRDITAAQSHKCAACGIGRTFQTPRVFESLSVIDNVLVGADSAGERLLGALGRSWRVRESETIEQARLALERVGLGSYSDDPVTDLSGGELRMLEVARQLVREPKLLLLDEPTAGVHPGLQERLAELLLNLHRSGMTLLVVEHNLRFLLALADRVLVMSQGQLLAEGAPSEIRSNPAVISAYLGDDHAV